MMSLSLSPSPVALMFAAKKKATSGKKPASAKSTSSKSAKAATSKAEKPLTGHKLLMAQEEVTRAGVDHINGIFRTISGCQASALYQKPFEEPSIGIVDCSDQDYALMQQFLFAYGQYNFVTPGQFETPSLQDIKTGVSVRLVRGHRR